MSSSAKHLQSQHPCEKGAATVKQHSCPVRLNLAFHSLQHNLTGLPFTNRKFHSCKGSRKKRKASLGAYQHRNHLQEHLDLLLQAGKPAQPSPLTRAAKRHSSTQAVSSREPQRLHYKRCPESKAFDLNFATQKLPQTNLLCCKDNRPTLSRSIANLQTFHLCHYSSSDKSTHLKSIQICATS